MEQSSNKAERLPTGYYSSMLIITILISIGFCCAILKVLPLHPETGWDDEDRNVTNAVMRLFLSCIYFYLIVCLVWTIKKRETLHRHQQIFWPLRCRHCARIGGLVSKCSQSRADGTKTTRRDMTRRRSLPLLPSIDNKSLDSIEPVAPRIEHIRQTSDNICLSNDKSETLKQEFCPINTETKQAQNTHLLKSSAFYRRPHKSLVILHNFFGTIALLNVPLETISIFLCLVDNNGSATQLTVNFNLVCEGVFYLMVTIGLACNLAFFNMFYDAVFLQTSIFPTFIGVYFASGLGLLALKLVFPLGVVAQPSHDPLLVSCSELPIKLVSVLRIHEIRATPLYTEICLISVGILWNIWASILPQSALKDIGNEEAAFEHFKQPCTVSIIITHIKNPRKIVRKVVTMWRKRFGVCHVILASLLAVSIFFSFDHFVVSRKSFNLSKITRTYILWCCNMICFLPFIALYRHQLFLSGDSKTFKLKDNVSFQYGLTGSQDVILLIGTGGMFLINIFRIVSAAGILYNHDSLSTDVLALACFGLIYYISQMYIVTSITSFLLIFQRKQIISKAEMKFVRICLMYTVCLNATDWLASVIDISDWKELTLYYGPVMGLKIARFLQPVIWLYFLHVTILAYETEKDIRESRKGCDTHRELSIP